MKNQKHSTKHSTKLEQWIEDIKLTQQSEINPEVSGEYLNRVVAEEVCVRTNLVCPSGLHGIGNLEECTYDFLAWISVLEVIPCGGGSGGGGGNPGNNDNPVITIPNLEDVEGINHVKELLKLSSKLLIKQKINNYRAKLATQRKEEGIMINPNGPLNDTIGGVSRKTDTRFYDFTLQHTVNIHMHQNLYYVGTTLKPTNPIPSDTDVISLSLAAYRFNNNPNNTSIIVTRLGTFAIRITDTAKALAAINTMDPDNNPDTKSELQQQFEDKYDKTVLKALEQEGEAAALQAFINFINTNTVNGENMGLSIYQATFNSSGTTITNWVKL